MRKSIWEGKNGGEDSQYLESNRIGSQIITETSRILRGNNEEPFQTLDIS